MQVNNVTNCYLFKNYYKPGIEYYYRTSGKAIKIGMPDTNSVDYLKNDSSIYQIQCIVLDKELSSLPIAGYHTVYEDQFVNVLLRNP